MSNEVAYLMSKHNEDTISQSQILIIVIFLLPLDKKLRGQVLRFLWNFPHRHSTENEGVKYCDQRQRKQIAEDQMGDDKVNISHCRVPPFFSADLI